LGIDKLQDYLEGAGHLYEPHLDQQNSFQSEMWAIGVIIASLYTKECYAADLQDYFHDMKKIARDVAYTMNDVLGKEKPAGMPEALHKIVNHITQRDPQDRPFSIAFADGIAEYAPLQKIVDVSKEAQRLKAPLKARVIQTRKDIESTHSGW